MVAAILARRKFAPLGLAIVIFAIGYGLFLADAFVDGMDGWGEVAAVIMGGGLLLAMVIGALALIELQRFLGKPVRRGRDEWPPWGR